MMIQAEGFTWNLIGKEKGGKEEKIVNSVASASEGEDYTNVIRQLVEAITPPLSSYPKTIDIDVHNQKTWQVYYCLSPNPSIWLNQGRLKGGKSSLSHFFPLLTPLLLRKLIFSFFLYSLSFRSSINLMSTCFFRAALVFSDIYLFFTL